ncbi:hypothetical protein pb186bvf_010626 [Paramecium bursaria]
MSFIYFCLFFILSNQLLTIKIEIQNYSLDYQEYLQNYKQIIYFEKLIESIFCSPI